MGIAQDDYPVMAMPGRLVYAWHAIFQPSGGIPDYVLTLYISRTRYTEGFPGILDSTVNVTGQTSYTYTNVQPGDAIPGIGAEQVR